jgi:pyrophosphate--fructose-6-phosphate 1-phosphotransferase
VIKKAHIDLKSKAFAYFQKHRDLWSKDDCFLFTGPIQYFGVDHADAPLTLKLNAGMDSHHAI